MSVQSYYVQIKYLDGSTDRLREREHFAPDRYDLSVARYKAEWLFSRSGDLNIRAVELIPADEASPSP